QERLHASEELFRGFAENSADVLWITDSTGTRLQYLSPAFEPMFGEGRDRIMSDLRRWAELVHPDDREHAASFMPRAIAGEVAIAHYRVVRPADGRIVHLRDTGFPIRDAASGTIRHVAGIVQDVSDLIQSGEALEAEKERFRTLAEGIPHLVWRSGENGVWNWSSPQWRDYTGQSQAQSQGLGWLDAVHPDDREATMRAWAGAQSLGRLDVEYRVRRASDGIWRYFSTRSVPLRGPPEPGYPDGRILEWLGTSTDIEDLKRLQGQQTVLVAELQHRTRNLLAVVRNVARRSIKPSPGRDEYDARLAALGRVQGFLSRSPLYVVPLADIVEAELAAAGQNASERVTISGLAVELPGEGVQAVALAVHELATNAVKYGAIAQPSGRLSVMWRVEAGDSVGERRLVIDWHESGIAMPDAPPLRRGYGSELITRALPYQLNAETDLVFTPDGVRCRIILPADRFRVRSGQESKGAQV
ncbi:MAG: sensor histidine kinase, partial [Gammaproteobacteria bacterium]